MVSTRCALASTLCLIYLCRLCKCGQERQLLSPLFFVKLKIHLTRFRCDPASKKLNTFELKTFRNEDNLRLKSCEHNMRVNPFELFGIYFSVNMHRIVLLTDCFDMSCNANSKLTEKVRIATLCITLILNIL